MWEIPCSIFSGVTPGHPQNRQTSKPYPHLRHTASQTRDQGATTSTITSNQTTNYQHQQPSTQATNANNQHSAPTPTSTQEPRSTRQPSTYQHPQSQPSHNSQSTAARETTSSSAPTPTNTMSTIASSNAHSTISHHQSPHTHINLQRLARSTHKATTTAISPRPNQPNQ